MTALHEIKSLNDIDIFGSQDYYEIVIDVLLNYNEDHLSLHKSFKNALELVRRAVWRNYGEATYLKYEDDIRHALFYELVEYVEMDAVENMKWNFEYENSIREFYESAMEPFLALDCLYANCVDIDPQEASEDDSIH